jgi:CHAT domain-containing protein
LKPGSDAPHEFWHPTGLELVDGRLTIRDLLQLRLLDTRFAYLSACGTYQSTEAIPDEAVTVATALCAAGCQVVVATLWQVDDDHAAEFARQMYDQLITYQNSIPTFMHAEARCAAPGRARRTQRARTPA